MRIALRLLRYALYLALAGVLLGGLAIGAAYWLIAPRLPSVETLRDVRLQVPLRVYSSDGKLMATFGETRRIPVKIENVPPQVKNAFIAVEDARFYDHPGFDWQGVARAVWLMATTGHKRVAGGSTITQQVARNFFLSSEVSFTRKVSEIFLAMRIEKELSKDEILSLYLNKIFLGNRAYGVAAAAEFYYGKTLDQLSLAEAAMLASLPKFPSTGNPLFNRDRAIERRNYVLERMLENGFIKQDEYKSAVAEADHSYAHEPPVEVDAPYLAEMVRQEAIEKLGNEALTDGYVIKATVDASMQEAANQALRDALTDYDHRHGYRGPEAHVDLAADGGPVEWNRRLEGYRAIAGLVPGIITQVEPKSALVYLDDGQTASLELEGVAWARAYIDDSRRGPAPKRVDELLKVGDVVRVARDAEGTWKLTQLPAAQGALVALDPEDGAIRAMVGGFSFSRSKFNRAVQSNRQPGSSFKPFLYSAAFEHGFTPASVLNDAPVVFDDPSKPNGIWTPKNDDDKFEGPMRLRTALAKSVNLISVRLLDAIGVRYAREYVTRFGLTLDQIPENLSMALGTASVAPIAMARGYAVFANGGFLVDPYFVSEIDDRDGKVVWKADPVRACRTCPERLIEDARQANMPADSGNSLNPIASAHANAPSAARAPAASEGAAAKLAPRAIDARNAYLVQSLMRDVIRHGTGTAALVLKRNDLAGKTGTTNDHRDAWFTGYNDRIVASTWVGFDDFSSLGRGEFGAKAALPMWIDFMRAATRDMPEHPFDMPPGVTTARIDPDTGALASASDGHAILEVFKVEDVQRLQAQAAQATQNGEQREAYDVF